VEEIKKIDNNREQRRRAAEEVRRNRQEEAEMLGAQCGGRAPDIDFHRMIRDFRQQCQQPTTPEPIDPNAADGIVVCVRKRPIQQHEIANRELDCVTARNPYAIIHERKFKVDGITKCLESHQFEFDRVFSEEESQDDVYSTITAPLVPWVIDCGGRATLFAYGQTGSGKTFTMMGIQRQMAEHIFQELSRYSSSKIGASEPLAVSVSFFEIYGGRPFDLLNNRQRLETLEDSRQEVQIAGLQERSVSNAAEMMQYMDLGNSLRTTHATAINRDSSRSHAVCCVFLRGESGGVHGKWTLVDLAGSERAADSKSSIRQRRVEGAQINKSLLALKECIRAMCVREAHIPFRASKLTLVLRDAFISRCPSKTVMIACISPGMLSADHSVNTLRYSDRLKDHPRASRTSQSGEDLIGDGSRQRTGSHVPNARDRSPDSRQLGGRGRSPSPSGVGCEPSRPRVSVAPDIVQQDVLQGDYIDDEEEIDDEDELLLDDDVRDAPAPQVQAAWVDAGAEGAAVDATRGAPRQLVSRRGRQPTLRPREAMAPNRPDALGSRADATSSRSAPSTAIPQAAVAAPAEAHRDRSPTNRVEQSGGTGAVGDLLQEDNRYLHNTLTSEVYERGGRSPTATVDVGVEDLTDLAHMEALDEVRQWEDRIVSQHMVALQEDARLLTVESELLSQVQQGAAYDIDWYVSEVDKVVRRKMEVYAGFLDELEVFKAQLRREESLSRSCQRNRPVTASGTGNASVAGAPAAVVIEGRDLGPALADATAQRTPRTPRTAVAGVIAPSMVS
jgi:kinesin family protein 2/24